MNQLEKVTHSIRGFEQSPALLRFSMVALQNWPITTVRTGYGIQDEAAEFSTNCGLANVTNWLQGSGLLLLLVSRSYNDLIAAPFLAANVESKSILSSDRQEETSTALDMLPAPRQVGPADADLQSGQA